ncbi:MAG: DoxX family protein [Arcobacteraceae bacterium]|jgi:putative oxidoreductase|nr:DoxX family protein [Arcobacteraceae bacterium]MDY0365931.1 DoxX family protein [Arcobacteraceae bacterium]
MICVEQQLVKLNSDIGKLILRVSLASLMLFHGYAKITGGIEGIKAMITSAGLPSFLAYGVYLGEFVFPLFIIAGLFTRTASLIFAFTMGFAIFLAHGNDLFTLSKHGGLAIELPLLYMMGAISLIFMGAGKYSFDKK